jgi:hypothetical protein
MSHSSTAGTILAHTTWSDHEAADQNPRNCDGHFHILAGKRHKDAQRRPRSSRAAACRRPYSNRARVRSNTGRPGPQTNGSVDLRGSSQRPSGARAGSSSGWHIGADEGIQLSGESNDVESGRESNRGKRSLHATTLPAARQVGYFERFLGDTLFRRSTSGLAEDGIGAPLVTISFASILRP